MADFALLESRKLISRKIPKFPHCILIQRLGLGNHVEQFLLILTLIFHLYGLIICFSIAGNSKKVPESSAGKIVAIVVVSLGLPLLLIYLSVTGSGLARMAKKVYSLLCCCQRNSSTSSSTPASSNNTSKKDRAKNLAGTPLSNSTGSVDMRKSSKSRQDFISSLYCIGILGFNWLGEARHLIFIMFCFCNDRNGYTSFPKWVKM